MIDKADVRSAIESARDLVMRVGHRDGPIDVIRLAHEAGVRVIEPANITADGYLGRQPDGTLVIRYRSQNAGNRNRFTIAHESHTSCWRMFKSQTIASTRCLLCRILRRKRPSTELLLNY